MPFIEAPPKLVEAFTIDGRFYCAPKDFSTLALVINNKLWKDAGLTPSGDWYVVTKAFMTATLKRANDEAGYFMTDSSTWAAEKKNTPKLQILFSGDKKLVNTYHALCRQTDGKPASDLAAGFIEFVASQKGQDIIRAFGKDAHGEALYNDAAYAKKYE